MATSHTSEIKVLRRPVESTFRPAVGVHDAVGLEFAAAGGHAQGVGDQLGPVMIGHRSSGWTG
ncbi:hypothetical protein [Streptomyces sp. H27-H5]|uniref:hypothetical protein n=1 Tax=Streptomyces sp. H27-H5 TaxID=2996460 RepID=UPI0022702AFA|nr:hypothetical protein [Streptomyces sp. H27-H5]MCY0963534.1 hypothetical protein [Streptomyces sp. H27-H5]